MSENAPITEQNNALADPAAKAPKNFFDEKYASVDDKSMQDGAEIFFGGDFFVTIRHVSSDAVSTARARITKQLRVLSRNKALTDQQNQEITAYVAAHAGIVGWRGGGVQAFSPEYALRVFKLKPEFLEDVVTAMTSYETFRQEDLDAAAGN